MFKVGFHQKKYFQFTPYCEYLVDKSLFKIKNDVRYN